jgi:Tfp pilus assembly ATPase PilU
MAEMYNMNDLLDLLAQERAEELVLQAGQAPRMVLRGDQRVIDDGMLTADNVAELFRSVATDQQNQELGQCGDVRFTFTGRNATRFSAAASMGAKTLN